MRRGARSRDATVRRTVVTTTPGEGQAVDQVQTDLFQHPVQDLTIGYRIIKRVALLQDERRIWSVESTSFEKASLDAIVDGASRALVTALGNDGLIR